MMQLCLLVGLGRRCVCTKLPIFPRFGYGIFSMANQLKEGCVPGEAVAPSRPLGFLQFG